MDGALADASCCSLCVLRFKGVQSVQQYRAALDVKAEAPVACCPCCLGVLQQIPRFADQIRDDVLATGFEVKDFNISVMLPAPIFIRQYGFWHHLVKCKG